MLENVAKLFQAEIRDKKRVGSNIFSRVSTRKGGSNQALRTPYLYMSRKERKQLNGEAKVIYNMNDILEYGAFKTRPEKDQIQLMTYWLDKYTKNDIRKAMKTSSSTFYRLLEKLELYKPQKGHLRTRSVNFVLTDEEIETYKKELIDYEIFRQISTEQQNILFEEYLKKYIAVADIAREWEGSSLGYLYNVSTRLNKIRERELAKFESEASVASENSTEDLESAKDDEGIVVENSDNQIVEEVSTEDDVIEESSKPVEDDNHGSDIEIDTNEFTFTLKGKYDSKTIIKRLQLALSVLEDEEELLDLEIKISKQ